MIPKKIHYCWLSQEPIPTKFQSYIDNWSKVMPDYQLIKWDTHRFDIHSSKWVEDAFKNRKWAFASDYIRAYALYNEGGFYLDTDVIVNGRFDEYLDHGFVSSIECNPKRWKKVSAQTDKDGHRLPGVDRVQCFGIQAAIIGCEPGHKLVKSLLDYYDSRTFFDGQKFDMLPAPYVYAQLLEPLGLVFKDRKQVLADDICLFRSNVFSDYQSCDLSSKVIHMCAGSWVDGKSGFRTRVIKSMLFVRKILNSIRYRLTD